MLLGIIIPTDTYFSEGIIHRLSIFKPYIQDLRPHAAFGVGGPAGQGGDGDERDVGAMAYGDWGGRRRKAPLGKPKSLGKSWEIIEKSGKIIS